MRVFEGLDVGGPAVFQNDVYIYGNLRGFAGLSMPYKAVTGAYTATESDFVINATSGTFTVTLPTAVGIEGRIYVIKNSGAGTVTLDGNGSETIDGGTTVSLSSQYQSVIIQSNGANWTILSEIA